MQAAKTPCPYEDNCKLQLLSPLGAQLEKGKNEHSANKTACMMRGMVMPGLCHAAKHP